MKHVLSYIALFVLLNNSICVQSQFSLTTPSVRIYNVKSYGLYDVKGLFFKQC